MIFKVSECYEENHSGSTEDDGGAEESGRTGSSESKESGEETEVKDFEEIYSQIALECFQYLGFKSFEEVDRLTIPEWKLLRKAIELKQEEKDYRNHLQAFLNFKAKARKKSGRPVFTIFKKFYDHEANLREIMKEENKTDRFARVKQLLKREEG